MKVKKIDKWKITVVIIVLLVFSNVILIYKPLNKKEERLLNQVKVINILQDDKLKNEECNENKKDLIINIENYFKDVSLVQYIKSSNDKNFTKIELNVTGDKNSISEKLKNIDDLSKNTFLQEININRIDENNIECSLELNMN
ncbi:MAG: hypothetical protein E7C86_00645 [Paeniclostridium sordellii]|uniref:Uncharacterized protein n=1 Tax=Paeniclostridium hominis TaxID=2764329 RepID=A0ABR7K511_9FIRM|nr:MULTISPECIES: hypothetical protein [Paeniclostridium]MBC6004198.1 hypothetical protein [Paeniclostridium hominis]MDU2591110.1 hypothetical protein [Paeniclostridium sordellii]